MPRLWRFPGGIIPGSWSLPEPLGLLLLGNTSNIVGSGAGHGSAGGSRHGGGGHHWIDEGLGRAADKAASLKPDLFGEDSVFAAFLSAVGFHIVITLCILSVFACLRKRYPRVYSNNSLLGLLPIKPDDSFLGWARASSSVTFEQAIETVGLDAAMTIEFTQLGMNMMLCIGLPMNLLLGPTNAFFGDGAAYWDPIGRLSIGNFSTCGWQDWLHALVIWAVVIFVPRPMYEMRKRFIDKRYDWLRRLPALRAHTVMVCNIPPELRSDSKLSAFFESILPGQTVVQRCYVMRRTTHLRPLWMRLVAARESLQEAEATWKANHEAGQGRPTVGLSLCGLAKKVDSIEHFTAEVSEHKALVEAERKKVLAKVAAEDGHAEADEEPASLPADLETATESSKENREVVDTSPRSPFSLGMNKSHFWGTAFVTFNSHLHREISLQLKRLYQRQGQVSTMDAPDPDDVLWDSIAVDDGQRQASVAIGWLSMFGVLLAYMPLVIIITNLAETIHLGYFQPIWAGVAPSLGLTFMISMLPTIIMVIITMCFPLRSSREAQHKLQKWYFAFQVFLVLLAASLGHDLFSTLKTLADRPLNILARLAHNMPDATTFYLNLLVLEWTDDAKQLLRLPELFKYVLMRHIFDEEKAKSLAEPEDQDYNGVGARSARMSISLGMGLVYGTLCPPVMLLCFLNMALKRFVFGYLLVFAETKKSDLGGVFWVQQTRGIFVACTIYAVLMSSVLLNRCGVTGPTLLAFPSVIYVIRQRFVWDDSFCWKSLPFNEVASLDVPESFADKYIQPELVPE